MNKRTPQMSARYEFFICEWKLPYFSTPLESFNYRELQKVETSKYSLFRRRSIPPRSATWGRGTSQRLPPSVRALATDEPGRRPRRLSRQDAFQRFVSSYLHFSRRSSFCHQKLEGRPLCRPMNADETELVPPSSVRRNRPTSSHRSHLHDHTNRHERDKQDARPRRREREST
jgi:hypothetical protein